MISATGHSKTKRPALRAGSVHSGFSLLELLIVLAVIGVMLSITSLSFRSFETDPVEKALQRLRFDVELLANEAIIRSEPLGLGFSANGYALYQLDEQQRWQPLKAERLLKPQRWPTEWQSALVLLEQAEGEAVTQPDWLPDLPELPDAEQAEDELVSTIEPQVLIQPTGELTAFRYELAAQGKAIQQIEFDSLGRVVRPVDAEEGAQHGANE